MTWWGSTRCLWYQFHQQNFDVQWMCLSDVACVCGPKEIPCNWLIAPSNFLYSANGTSHPISLIHFQIMSQSMARSYKFSGSFRFSSKNTVCISFSPMSAIYLTHLISTHVILLQIWWVKNLIVTAVYWTKVCELFHMESAIIVVPAVTEIVQR